MDSAMMLCVQVSELQGSMQDLEEALDKEVAAHKDSKSTLEEAYCHRNRLEARYAAHQHQTSRLEIMLTLPCL